MRITRLNIPFAIRVVGLCVGLILGFAGVCGWMAACASAPTPETETCLHGWDCLESRQGLLMKTFDINTTEEEREAIWERINEIDRLHPHPVR